MKSMKFVLAIIATGVFFAQTATAVTLQVNDTKVTLGGYIKLDVQYSDPGMSGNGTAFPLSYLPAEGSKRDATVDFSARQSRFWFKTSTDLDTGKLTSHFEGDFYGSGGNEMTSNSYGFRLRHAYLTYNNWLAGQTWSSFIMMQAVNELLDFGQTRSGLLVRQAQIRYTHPLANGSLVFALENPENVITSPAGAPAANSSDKANIPDIVARWNLKGERWCGMLALLGRQFKIDDGAGNTEEDYGLAASLSGNIQLTDSDSLKFQINGGALGRYMAMVAHPGATYDGDKLEVLNSYGANIGIRHKWSPRLRTNLVIAASRADVDDDSALFESSRSGHINLLWNVARPLVVGAELSRIEGERGNGGEVEFNRLLFSAQYFF